MRIAHLVRQYAPAIGGLESFVAGLSKEMTNRGHQCEVITLDRAFERPTLRLPPSECIDGVLVRRVRFWGHRRLFAPVAPRALLKDYDVLHVHGVDGLFERVARQPRRPDQLRIATSHGLMFHTPFLAAAKRLYFSGVTRLAAQAYDGLIANSGADARAMQCLAPPVELIPNGIAPLGDFTAQGADLLYLGRVAGHKHIHNLLRALAQPSLTDVRLHVVGGEWDVKIETLRALAAALGVAERVTFHGQLDLSSLETVTRDCGVFVSASAYEGFGMSLIEAMSVGLAPVAHANASFVELAAMAPVGVTTDFADAPRAAAAVRAELDQLTPARRRAAIDFARRFSWAAHTERTLAFYEGLRASKSPARAAA